jgi:hypothetical protein
MSQCTNDSNKLICFFKGVSSFPSLSASVSCILVSVHLLVLRCASDKQDFIIFAEMLIMTPPASREHILVISPGTDLPAILASALSDPGAVTPCTHPGEYPVLDFIRYHYILMKSNKSAWLKKTV